MKKIFTLLTLLSLGFTGFAQKTEAGDYDDLMRRSRKARTTSIILVSTGPVVAVGGIGTLIYGVIENDLDNGRNPVYDQNGNFIGYDNKNYTTEIVVGAVATAVGIGIALSSIHFSKKANELKREARGAKLKTSMDRINIPGLQNSFTNTARQYKLSLVIPLGS
ncbi:MAG: hypothetical protein ABIR78_09305 [Ferruginibacter sp.]